jgi:hypothetical protein
MAEDAEPMAAAALGEELEQVGTSAWSSGAAADA